MSTVMVEPRPSNVAVPDHGLRVFSARLAYEAHQAVNPRAGSEMTVLLRALEKVTRDAAPDTAREIADAVEFAMACGGVG